MAHSRLKDCLSRFVASTFLLRFAAFGTKKKIVWRTCAMTDFVSVENVTDELNATGTFDEAG